MPGQRDFDWISTVYQPSQTCCLVPSAHTKYRTELLHYDISSSPDNNVPQLDLI